MKVAVDNKIFRVEFFYATKKGKHPKLGRDIPIAGVTHCVILEIGSNFVADGIAVCSSEDAFSRPVGRAAALNKALTRNKALSGIATQFMTEYWKIVNPCPKFQPAQLARPKLSPERIAALRAAGQDGKLERRAARALSQHISVRRLVEYLKAKRSNA